MSTLRLKEREAQAFLEALHAYDYDRVAPFLRACAQALSTHYANGDRLATPLSFRVQKRP